MRRGPVRQRGFSLIELVIALLIGLLVVGAVLIGYLGASTSARHLRALAVMTEDAQIALQFMARDLRLAGDISVTALDVPAPGTAGNTTLHRPSQFLPVQGCSQGFAAKPATPLATGSCASTAEDADAIQINYEPTKETTFLSSSSAKVANSPTDCLGRGVLAGTGTSNFYSVQTNGSSTRPELYCDSLADGGRQPLVDDVEALRFRYAEVVGWDLQNPASRQPVRYVLAKDVQNWSNVVAVRLCVLMRSADPVLTSEDAPGYRDCDGHQQTASDHLLRRAFQTTVALRNKALF